MATIFDLLPKFHQIEANNLKGLQPGFVVSQMNVVKGDSIIKEVNGVRYVENGMLGQITKSGIKAADGTEKVLFIAYSEPIVTFGHNVSNYATDIDSEDIRMVQLIPGDEWTTDIKPEDTAYAAEIAAGRIAEVTGAEGDYSRDDFLATTELADGTEAHHYVFLG
jgi:hypothetical protein